jgi:hypothetical protein
VVLSSALVFAMVDGCSGIHDGKFLMVMRDEMRLKPMRSGWRRSNSMVIWVGLAVKTVKSFGVGSWAVVGQGRKWLKSCSAWCCKSFVVIGSCFE